MRCCTSFGLLVARVLIATLFIWAGVAKLTGWDNMVSFMASKGMTSIPFFLGASALIELLAGISLVVGFKTRFSAFVLFLFLIPINYFMHDFWNLTTEQEQTKELIHFLSNLAIMGGLLSLVCSGSGNCSLDACCGKDEASCCK